MRNYLVEKDPKVVSKEETLETKQIWNDINGESLQSRGGENDHSKKGEGEEWQRKSPLVNLAPSVRKM